MILKYAMVASIKVKPKSCLGRSLFVTKPIVVIMIRSDFELLRRYRIYCILYKKNDFSQKSTLLFHSIYSIFNLWAQ